MPEAILLDITIVILLGIGAQWMAWHFRLPSILLLLVLGFLAGPVFQLLDPEALQQDWIFAFVSVSVGIILFEGGLSLRLSELREVGGAVLKLLTIGVLLTWALGAAAAHYILTYNVSLAILLGAILTVTGPTVVLPLLRHVRPKGRVGTIAKWEGITIDPVGAILAVLTLEALLLLNDPQRTEGGVSTAVEHVALGLGLEIFVALGISVAATLFLVLVLYRRLVPDFLRNSITLMVVIVAFVLSNFLQHESGLLTATLMGIALANQPYVSVHHITEFKENLQVLLIGSLFVILSARLELSALNFIDGRLLLFVAILVVLVRPLSVLISTVGSNLAWEEKVFLSWLAPRGVVAAAVAALFAYQLRPIYPTAVEGMVPEVFAIIVGTVAIYGLTSAPLAQWLDLADPNPNGLLFVGAAPWVCRVAQTLQDLGYGVSLVDNNPAHIKDARERGLSASQGNALSEAILDELDLSSTGRLLITIPNDEVASLTALHFSEVFETTDIYQLAAHPESRHGGEGVMPKHLRGRPLFGEDTNYHSLQAHATHQGSVKVLKLAETVAEEGQEYYNYEDLMSSYEESAVIPLFVLRASGELEIVSERDQFQMRPDDRLVALVGADSDAEDDDHKTPAVEQVPGDGILEIDEPVEDEETSE